MGVDLSFYVMYGVKLLGDDDELEAAAKKIVALCNEHSVVDWQGNPLVYFEDVGWREYFIDGALLGLTMKLHPEVKGIDHFSFGSYYTGDLVNMLATQRSVISGDKYEGVEAVAFSVVDTADDEAALLDVVTALGLRVDGPCWWAGTLWH